jgi:hypothetical protein
MVNQYHSKKKVKHEVFSSIKKITKKHQISDSLKNRKQIYIYSNNGFGNKIFSLICAIYLYNYYEGKCDINYIITKSVHEDIYDLDVQDIFPRSLNKIKYIFTTPEYFKQSIKRLKMGNLFVLYNINKFPKYNNLPNHFYVRTLYNLTYKMYNTFKDEDKAIFNINPKLITDNRVFDIIKNNYSIVHIRYGDKISITANNLKTPKFDYFLLNTPNYYIDMIKMLLQKSHKIVILSDSFELVNKFIIENNFENNKNIILLDTNWLNSFYLFYYASNIIMSSSTFSIAGCYFNKKNANCYLNLYHSDLNKHLIPEEYAISPKWKISHNKKYTLNYNIPLLKKLLDYCNKNNLKCGEAFFIK